MNTYVNLMYELKKIERYLRLNLLGPGPRLIKKNYRAAVSQRLRNIGLDGCCDFVCSTHRVHTMDE
jgi:hypothetical protein